jgi:lipopolysaccharide heptosyltransferase II
MEQKAEKKNILIINLTRMGDLLQTTPLIVGLKEKYPLSQIALLASSVFSEICKGFPCIDKLHILDIARYRSIASERNYSLVQFYREIEKEVNILQDQKFDLVINTVLSKTSTFLAYLLKAPEVIGFHMDGNGHRIIHNPWINYFTNKLFNREYNLFNLIDVFLRCAGVTHSPKRLFYHTSKEGEAICRKLLAENGIDENDFVIGFQPGASREIRQWPLPYFAELAEKLIEKFNAKILLFGSPVEEELGRELENQIKHENVTNLIGKTDLEKLAGLLKRCRYLITGDTGTMHLASAVGTRIIALFFGSAYCFETGPYGEGHIVVQADIPCFPCHQNVECKNPLCRTAIEPDHILSIIGSLKNEEQNEKGFSFISKIKKEKQVRIYATEFDREDFLTFVPLLKKKIRKEDFYSYCYKEMWHRELDGEWDKPLDISALFTSLCSRFDFNDVSEQLQRKLLDDSAELKGLNELSGKGISLARSLVSIVSSDKRLRKNFAVVKKMNKELGRVDEAIISLGTVHKFIRPLTQMFIFGKENLTGKELLPLCKKTLCLYENLQRETGFMLSILGKISLLFVEKKEKKLFAEYKKAV